MTLTVKMFEIHERKAYYFTDRNIIHDYLVQDLLNVFFFFFII